MPDDRDLAWDANRLGDKVAVQFINPGNGLALKRHNDITLAQTGTGCGTARLDAGDQHPVLHPQTVKPNDSPVNGHILVRNPDPTAADAAFLDEPVCDEFDGVAGDGKATA